MRANIMADNTNPPKRRVQFTGAELTVIRTAIYQYSQITMDVPVETAVVIAAVNKKLLAAMLELELISLDGGSGGTGTIGSAAATATIKPIQVSAAEIAKHGDSRLDYLQRKIEAGEDISIEENEEMMKLLGLGT